MTMETARGDVRMRRIKRHLGDKIVNYAGTEEQRKRFGNKLLSIAMTEPGAGSDPSMIRGTARYDDATGEWILNAEKIYCSAFGASDGAFVFVRGPEKDGVRPFMGFVVEKGTPGLVELGQVRKMGIRSWDTADFVLQDCRVPAINKIDVDFKKTMIVFNGMLRGVAAMGLAIAGSLLEFTREKLFGKDHAIDYTKGIRSRTAIEDRLIRLEAFYEATLLTILRCKWLEHRDGKKQRLHEGRGGDVEGAGRTGGSEDHPRLHGAARAGRPVRGVPRGKVVPRCAHLRHLRRRRRRQSPDSCAFAAQLFAEGTELNDMIFQRIAGRDDRNERQGPCAGLTVLDLSTMVSGTHGQSDLR